MLNAIAMLSGILCVATAVMWVRSYYIGDSIHLAWPEQGLEMCWVYSARGELWLGVIRLSGAQQLSGSRWFIRRDAPRPVEYSNSLFRLRGGVGFGYSNAPQSSGRKWQGIAFPYAVPLLLWLILFVIACR